MEASEAHPTEPEQPTETGNAPKPAGTRRKFLTVRRVPKNRKTVEPQPAAEETSDFQDLGFSKRLGELFPHSGFGKRLGEPVRESTEREERLIDQKVEFKLKLDLEVPESTGMPIKCCDSHF